MKKAIECVFTSTMTAILVLLLFFSGSSFAAKKYFAFPNSKFLAIAFAVAVAILIVAKMFKRLMKAKIGEIDGSKLEKLDKIVFYMSWGLFFTEVYICFNIIFASNWDPGAVWFAALSRAYDDLIGMGDWNIYLSRYPNNHVLLFLYTACYRFNQSFGIFGEQYSRMLPVVIDCATISGAVYLTYKELCLIVKKNYAFLGFVLCVLLAGLSPWMVICYSDSLAIFFPISTLYLYTKPYKAENRRIAGRIVAVVVCCFGYFIKPQCAIVLIAIVCLELINYLKCREFKKLSWLLLLVVCAAICVSVNSSVLTAVYEAPGIHMDAEKKFGMSHFLMMGLNEESGGAYSDDDVDFSSSIESAKERTSADFSRAMERVRAMGVIGYVKHICKKLLTAYHDGTFAWGMEGSWYNKIVEDVNRTMAPFLQSLFYIDGSRYEVLKNSEQLVWIFTLLFTTLAGFFRGNEESRDTIDTVKLSIVGLTMFQILFEVRARYLFLYVPFFCMLAAVGFSRFEAFLNEKWTGLHNTSAEK